MYVLIIKGKISHFISLFFVDSLMCFRVIPCNPAHTHTHTHTYIYIYIYNSVLTISDPLALDHINRGAHVYHVGGYPFLKITTDGTIGHSGGYVGPSLGRNSQDPDVQSL